MFRDSEARSERTPSIRMGSNDDLSSPRTKYSSDNSLVSDRGSSSKSSSGEASPSGQLLREVILPNDWSIHDFLVDMNDKFFSRLRPRFQIPNNVSIKRGDFEEKYYNGKSSDISFYEATFIAGFCLPLSTLHRQLAFFLGVSISQIAPNTWRIFIRVEALEEFSYCSNPMRFPYPRVFITLWVFGLP